MSLAPVLSGLTAYLPPRRLSNEDLSRNLDITDEWVRRRTGIGWRHVVDSGVGTVDLATEVSGRLLKALSPAPRVDAVVLATTSADRLCPAGAPEVAARLGLGDVAAYDIAAACSGYLYGLANSVGLIMAGMAQSVLLVTAEAFSTMTDPADRVTGPLFGDGAGATLLTAGDAATPGAIGPFDLGSDGAGCDLLAIPAGGSRQRFAGQDREYFLQMDGAAVFKNAIHRLVISARTALEKANWSPGDVDAFVCHQANQRILTAVGDRLLIPAERVVSNVEHVGNTVSASVPIALAHAVDVGRLNEGDRVLLSAFGAGFSWGSTTLVWPDVHVEFCRGEELWMRCSATP